MAFISYLLGRKYYRVAYDLKWITFYIVFGLGLYFAREPLLASGFKSWQAGTMLIGIYTLSAALFESRGMIRSKKKPAGF
jgi:hypothetical protein